LILCVAAGSELLLSLAVADVSQYGDGLDANIIVSAAITADEKHIIDSGDNFELESLWVQQLVETWHINPTEPAPDASEPLVYDPNVYNDHSNWLFTPTFANRKLAQVMLQVVFDKASVRKMTRYR
jgi:hypothetical protein